MLSKPQSLALITSVFIRKILLFVQELPLFDRVCDPSGLVYISVEKVLRCQRIIDWLQLISKTLMEFRKDSSIFLNNDSYFLFFFIFSTRVGVGNEEDYIG